MSNFAKFRSPKIPKIHELFYYTLLILNIPFKCVNIEMYFVKKCLIFLNIIFFFPLDNFDSNLFFLNNEILRIYFLLVLQVRSAKSNVEALGHNTSVKEKFIVVPNKSNSDVTLFFTIAKNVYTSLELTRVDVSRVY